MAWFWARVKARTPRLGTFVGGFQAFMEALAEDVRRRGAEIRLRTPLEKIEPAEGRLRLITRDAAETFDQALVTTSPGLLARMTPSLPPAYLQGLRSLRAMGAVVLVLALRHRLSEEGIYWHNLPKAAGFPFLALVEHTNFIPPQNHSRAIPALKTPVPGLWFASMSQVYPWDRGTNFAVEVARRAAGEMSAAAAAGPTPRPKPCGCSTGG